MLGNPTNAAGAASNPNACIAGTPKNTVEKCFTALPFRGGVRGVPRDPGCAARPWALGYNRFAVRNHGHLQDARRTVSTCLCRFGRTIPHRVPSYPEPGAVGLADQAVGFRCVFGLHRRGVPLDPFLQPYSQVAHQQGFGVGPGVREARLGVVRLAGLARLDPLDPMSGRTRDCLRRVLETLPQTAWEQAGHARPAAAEDRALLADEVNPIVRQVDAFVQVLGPRRHLPAVVPEDLHRRPVAAGRELVGDDLPGRKRLRMRRGRLGLGRHGRVQVQRVKRRVHVVNGHVAHGARAVIKPCPPFPRMVRRMIRPRRSTAQEQVPVQAVRHGRRIGRPVDWLRPELARPVAPAMDFPDRADGAGLNQLARRPDALAAVAGIAHLRHQPGFPRDAGHHPRFLDAVAHRLLDVHMLAGPQRGQRDRRMHMVGSGDDHGVDVLALVEQDAVVLEHLGLGEPLEGVGGDARIGVAQGDDVLAADILVGQ